MAELLSSPPPKELDERQVAKAALEAAEEQLRSLCASNAGTFVDVERRSANLASALADLQDKIKVVEPSISDVQQVLEDGNSLTEISEKHRVRRRTLLQYSSLLELLELPSLMDACVRSNLYEEALSIASFANTLKRRHTDKNIVVLRVIDQIRSRQLDLRRHLIHRLKQNITMPQCLEVLTALRRLNSIDLEGEKNIEELHDGMELKLQVDFLEARDTWLESSPRTNNTALGPGEQLLDTIERYRTRVFEIGTQFNAIFGASMTKQSVSSSNSLLSMWITRRIHLFLTMITSSVNRMEDSAILRDALEACVFFASSMARLGGDFKSMLSDIFESKMVSLVTNCWKEGVSTLQETLKVCRDAGVVGPLISPSIAPQASGISPEQPPRQLLSHPPLARMVNSYLSGFNELRRCLLPNIFVILRNELKDSLKNVKAILETNQRTVNAPALRGEASQLHEAAESMMIVFDNIVEPYITGALEVALGNFKAGKELLLKQMDKVEEESEEEEEKENEEGKESEEGEGKESEEEEGKESKEDDKSQELDDNEQQKDNEAEVDKTADDNAISQSVTDSEDHNAIDSS